METAALIVVAFALAVDAFSVATASGLVLPEVGWRRTLRLAWHFGLFQSLMTLAGFGSGEVLRMVAAWLVPWIAFLLLVIVGGNMLVEGYRSESEDSPKKKKDPTKGGMMVFLSVATSLDAFAVGVSLATVDFDLVFALLVIGFMAFGMTVLGMKLGEKIKRWGPVERYAQYLGGVVLIGIGVRILFEHLV